MSRVRQRLRRWPTWFVLVGVVLVIGAALRAPLPYFTEMPGSVVTLGGCVNVHADDAQIVHGDFLLTTVSLRKATPASLLRVAVDNSARLRPDERVVTPGVDERDHFTGQRRVFARSAQRAAALGLSAAGFGADPDRYIGDGALVTGVVADGPAYGVLRGGDVILQIDGEPIGTEAEVRASIEDTDPMVITYERDGESQTVELAPSELTVDGEVQPALGLRLETLNSRVDLPVPVDVDSGRIGGPSAGLMIGLAVYDQGDPTVDLAAGRRIAGTGTLTSQGVVGRIGGVELKALAAHRKGVDVFLAPATQAEQADALVPRNSTMEVVPVATFEEAVQYLTETAESAGIPADLQRRECPLRPAA